MFNKMCFYATILLGLATFSLDFLRTCLDIDVIGSLPVTHDVLVYARGLPNPAKAVLAVCAASIIIILCKGFVGHIKTLQSR